MRENLAFKRPAESQIILRDFDAPANMVNYYIQRLTSYLQVELCFNCKLLVL